MRCPRAKARHFRSWAVRASCLPALRPAREVHRWKCDGNAAGKARFSAIDTKPGPGRAFGMESPLGRSRGGTPEGERARWRAPQPGGCGRGPASFGGLLPSFFL